MNYSEQPLAIPCDHETLIGLLTVPAHAGPAASTGIIIIVGGPQYRVGSHRQFVLLARALAGSGFPVLRFDYCGMGDSPGSPKKFDTVSSDLGAAIAAMHLALPDVTRYVLWGLCDGASAALLYCHETGDVRVQGLCLLNPWVRSEASLARTHVRHYYLLRLTQREFWLKLLRGQVAGAALARLWRNIRLASGPAHSGSRPQAFQDRMATAWRNFEGDILLVLSGNDYTAREFEAYVARDPAWTGALERSNVTRRALAQADHTFSAAAQRAQVEAITCEWLNHRARS